MLLYYWPLRKDSNYHFHYHWCTCNWQCTYRCSFLFFVCIHGGNIFLFILLLPFKILFFHKFFCQSSRILYLASCCPLYLSYWYDKQCVCYACTPRYTHVLIVHSQICDSNHTKSLEWLVIVRVLGQQTPPNCLQYQKIKPYKMKCFLSPVQRGKMWPMYLVLREVISQPSTTAATFISPCGDPTHLSLPHLLLSCPFCSCSSIIELKSGNSLWSVYLSQTHWNRSEVSVPFQ